jgi:hypothetical protein
VASWRRRAAAATQPRRGGEGSGSVELDARVRVEQQALACLAAGVVWVLLRTLGPEGLRLGESIGDGAPIGAFIALVGCGSHSLALAALAFRPLSAPWSGLAAALSLGLGWALAPWTLFAYGLWLATRHRPLGALTFAVGATLLGVAFVVAARRLLVARAEGHQWATVLVYIGRALALFLLVLALVTVLRSVLRVEHGLEAALSDAVLGLLLTVLVVASPMVRWPARIARGMPRVCVGVWVLTLGLVGISPEVRATLKSAPLVAGIVGLALR